MDQHRYYGLDALRGGMMLLGLLLHGATFYLAAPPPTIPLISDHNATLAMDALFHFIHSFRMPTFFVLAGFFGSLLIEKRGLRGTWKNRAARIGGPFLAAMITVVPIAGLFSISLMVSVRFGTHAIIPELSQVRAIGQEMVAAGFPVDQPSPAHLWFLYYLMYFYAMIPLFRYVTERTRAFEGPIGRLLNSPWMFVGLGLYTAATLWPYRGGQVHEGFLFFKPHLPSLIYYGSFFFLGYFFHTHRTMLGSFVRHAKWCAALAVVLFPLSVYLSYIDVHAVPQAASLHLAATLAQAFCTWGLVYFCIGSALRLFDQPTPWILYTSRSSYWVFLVHLPLATFASWWLVQFDLPGLFKFACVVTFTTVLSFLSYHYWVQRTWMSVFLNGKRFDMDWPWRTASPIGSLDGASTKRKTQTSNE